MIVTARLQARLHPRRLTARISSVPLQAALDTGLRATLDPLSVAIPVQLIAPHIYISTDDPITPSSTHYIFAPIDVTIYFTTDGSDPTKESTLYTGPFALPAGTYTIKARAYAPGYSPSDVAVSAEFEVASPVTATPVITRDGPGLYEITCATEGASIYYTTNGETPTADSAIYSIPLSIIQPTTLKAIAIKDEISSEVSEMVITESVWTIASTADGTKYVRIQCATTGQTLTAAGGAEIKLESGGEWGTSAVIPAGNTNRYIYFRGNGTGGTLTFPNPENITYLNLSNTGTSITGSVTGMPLTYLYLYKTGTSITGTITGMELTYLYLFNTGTAITGSITEMELTYLYLNDTGTSITGSITGMELTYLYLFKTGTSITGSITGMPLTYLYLFKTDTAITGSITEMELTYLYLNDTGTSITGSITGMELTYLYLYGTGTSITGVPPAIGKTLQTFRILGGTSYDYPWTEQAFLPPKRTWPAYSIEIDCLSTVGVVEFNTWLKRLASVSNPGTATLILKNTPTIDDLNDAGCGETDETSGYYAMVTTLGYNLSLGT